ncbi:hypothetical protein KSF78_0004333 [Schistosoma japonicum]|nr:hypothetical protein KSF78_0004333 [Schistosoma japonicum]KAH8869362.1 hypothetical protein KSF78_0004333 [Schistosoma japonicum]
MHTSTSILIYIHSYIQFIYIDTFIILYSVYINIMMFCLILLHYLTIHGVFFTSVNIMNLSMIHLFLHLIIMISFIHGIEDTMNTDSEEDSNTESPFINHDVDKEKLNKIDNIIIDVNETNDNLQEYDHNMNFNDTIEIVYHEKSVISNENKNVDDQFDNVGKSDYSIK